MEALAYSSRAITIVNDIHAQLNEVVVKDVIDVDSLDALQSAVAKANAASESLALAGGRHAMGGQQFLAGGTLLDTTFMNKVLDFDPESGLMEVEAGVQWPRLVEWLIETQAGTTPGWAIRQKQTGADSFTLGGSVSANCHGRGLTFPPIAGDIESLRLVAPDGSLVTCDRTENSELFSLALGGYGLFGAIYSVQLRLDQRRKLERVVDVKTIDSLVPELENRIDEGFLYGDFQFAIDSESADFLEKGVCSCYRPVGDETPIASDQRALKREDWQLLLTLAHTDKSQAFDEYVNYYTSTSGQIYWSDLHQFADYVGGYHQALDALSGTRATEMITEIYVPRDRLATLMSSAAAFLRERHADVIYGTVRLIRKDTDSFLAWAEQDYACTIFNLHVVHEPAPLAAAQVTFRGLIDLALGQGGSFFLTYHRWASREQVIKAYPQFAKFLAAKLQYDPSEVFQSEWYRHHKELVAAD